MTMIRPYGDTIDDGKVQASFTLPIKDGDLAAEAARMTALKMGLREPSVVYHTSLGEDFSFFIVYGSLGFSIDASSIHVRTADDNIMSMKEIDDYITINIGRKIVVAGASTGTDAHTVGIDAIMNMKGFNGHYGLERYNMLESHNLGSQVPNEEFIRKAVVLKADVLLVSQTVTQKNMHIKNMTELVEMLEAEGLRDDVVLICGGPGITFELAKEIGYDAGFGPGKYAEHVASFFAREIAEKNNITG